MIDCLDLLIKSDTIFLKLASREPKTGLESYKLLKIGGFDDRLDVPGAYRSSNFSLHYCYVKITIFHPRVSKIKLRFY